LNTSSASVEVTTHSTNLNFSTVVALKGITWDVYFSNNSIKATSRTFFPAPDDSSDKAYDDMRYVLQPIVGHIRNLASFSLGLDVKWGFEGHFANTGYNYSDMIFPSIHQQQTNTFGDENINRAQRMIKDIGSSRKKGLKTMLNYWRRAAELDELGYNSESFLDYYKIIECLAELCTDDGAVQKTLDRFCPSGHVQSTLKRKYHCKTANDEKKLKGHIKFVAKALSSAGRSDRVGRGFFTAMLDCVFIRHNWNVAHKLIRSNPYDNYDAIGQHSDEFDLVQIENIYISTITKLLVLLYVKPDRYKIDVSQGIGIVVPKP